MFDPRRTEVTVRQLLALGLLGDSTIVGGTAGLDLVVKNVVATSTFAFGSLPASSLVVMGAASLEGDTYQIDLALRAVENSAGVALIVAGPVSSLITAPGRLADRLGLPLIIASCADALMLADEIRQAVAAPQLNAARILLASLDSLRASGGSDLKGSMSRLSALINAPVTLVGVDNREVVGPTLSPPLDPYHRPPVPMTTRLDDVVQVAHPMHLTFGERPSFWLVARCAQPTETWISVVPDILQMAAWALGARLVADRLQNERDARFRLGVLNSIVAATDGPGADLVEQIGVLEWRLDGWCTAVHVQARGDVDQQRVLSITEHLALALRGVGIDTPLVERPDGWTFWIESPAQPATSSYADLETKLLEAMRSTLSTYASLSLQVGIGLPHIGFAGLQSSLAEAREASIMAQAAGGRAAIQHIDALGVKRILSGWYTSEHSEEFASSLLDPLAKADSSGELIATLECYLDSQSSPTLTAARMFTHRNTVLNRMERVRSKLAVDLDDPEERLAVQLACRMYRLRGAASHGSQRAVSRLT